LKKNTGALLEISREVALEGNTEKTKCIVMSHHQNIEQRCNLLIAIKPLKMWQSTYIWE